jgi:pimeloyl-ACP methyl ester carboxylesterase
VLLHGIGGAAELWEEVAQRLDGFRVLAWSQPGYGASPPLPEVTFPALAASLGRMMDEAGIARAGLVGHSMGGMVAQEFALAAPERARRLVLVATTSAFGGRDPAFAGRFLAARLAPLDAGAGMAACAEGLVAGLFGRAASEEARRAALRAMSEVPEATYRAALRCLTTFDRRAELPRIAQPALLVAGAEDETAPARTMARMAEAMPDARLVTLPTGHMPHLEAPEALAREIGAFLRA